jgi:soluble lytic murein transglycosylase-like protein
MSYVEVLCSIVISLGMPNSDVACKHMETIIDASDHYDLEPELMISLIHHESRWTHDAVSRSGACGLTQVLPKYTKNPKLTCNQLKNPETSIWAGAKALNFWLHKYKRNRGSIKLALCGYNAGFRCLGPNPNRKGMRYSKKIRRLYRRIVREVRREVPGC